MELTTQTKWSILMRQQVIITVSLMFLDFDKCGFLGYNLTYFVVELRPTVTKVIKSPQFTKNIFVNKFGSW